MRVLETQAAHRTFACAVAKGQPLDARCRIELLGEMRVLQGDQVHTRFRTHKAAFLLAYLALNLHQAHPRERLVELFWADKEIEAGRDGLSTALSQLRRQLQVGSSPANGLFVADWQQVRLNPEIVTTDVADFERLQQQAKAAEEKPAQAELLRQAVRLYRGELLPGCYEEWASRAQSHYQSLYVDSLRQLIRLLEETEQYTDALPFVQKAMEADPYAEDVCRMQMRLLVRLRQPSAALQTYDRLERMFKDDLGLLPSAATRQMADAIRQDPRAAALLRAEAASATRAVAPSPAAESVTAPASPVPSMSSAAPALPLQLTRFVGRRQEQAQLAQLLQTPGVRLVSILGPGGAGKTRLSIEVGAQVASSFAGGVWFIPLADIPDASLIPSVLINTLHVPPDGAKDPLDRIVAHLGDRPRLLILDNLEHLLRDAPTVGKNENPALSGSVAVIRLLLERVPNLVCLATSRMALRLRGEQEFYLPPLALPEAGEATSSELMENDSIALYVDRARATRLDFALTDHNKEAITRLCRRLEGMPLAIEMAAAWAKTITPQKMLERLDQQLNLLVSRNRDLPPRHQSLRATIEWSYDLLSPPLRDSFARLGVFRGGWTLEAAEAVCGLDAMHTLAELQEQSLVVVQKNEEGEPRYRLLEPLREFALEKLQEAGAAAAAQQAHTAFFEAMVNEAWDQMDTAGLKEALDRLQREHENIRQALAWCEANALETGLHIAGHLWRFWEVRGHVEEGRGILKAMLARYGEQSPSVDQAQAQHAAGALAAAACDYQDALHHYEQARRLAQELGDSYRIALAKQQCALVTQEQGDNPTAARLLEEAIALFAELKAHGQVANNRCNLAVALIGQGEYARAQQELTQALVIQRESGDLRSIAISLNNLGGVMLKQGDCETARACLAESLEITLELGAKRSSAYCLEGFGELAAYQQQWERAVYLWGAAHGLRERHAYPLTPAERVTFDAQLSRARAQLGEESFAQAWDEGRSASFDQGVAEALG